MKLFSSDYKRLYEDFNSKRKHFFLFERELLVERVSFDSNYVYGDVSKAKTLVSSLSKKLSASFYTRMRWPKEDSIRQLVHLYGKLVNRMANLVEEHMHMRINLIRMIEEMMEDERKEKLFQAISHENGRGLEKLLSEISMDEGRKRVIEGSSDEFLYKFIQGDVLGYITKNISNWSIEDGQKLFMWSLSELKKCHYEFLQEGAMRKVVEGEAFKGLSYLGKETDLYKEFIREAEGEKKYTDEGIRLIGGFLNAVMGHDVKALEAFME